MLVSLERVLFIYIFSMVVSDLPAYCFLHNLHSRKYIRYLLLQLSLKGFCVAVLLKMFLGCTCVEDKLLNLELQDFK